MYSITSKFNSNVSTTSKATADKTTAKAVGKIKHEELILINLKMLSLSHSKACLRNFEHFFPFK